MNKNIFGCSTFTDHDGSKKLFTDFSNSVVPRDNKVLIMKLKTFQPKQQKMIMSPRSSNEADSKCSIGIIIAVGPNTTIAKNSYVIFSKWSGIDLLSSSGEFVLLKEDEIVAVINKENISEYNE